MFDIGWSEMALVAVVALFVVGPKDLPHVLYKMAGYWKKVRGMAREFQGSLDNMIREAELDELRKQVSDASSGATEFLEKKIDVDAETKKSAPTKAEVSKADASATSTEGAGVTETADASAKTAEPASEPAKKASSGATKEKKSVSGKAGDKADGADKARTGKKVKDQPET